MISFSVSLKDMECSNCGVCRAAACACAEAKEIQAAGEA